MLYYIHTCSLRAVILKRRRLQPNGKENLKWQCYFIIFNVNQQSKIMSIKREYLTSK